MKVAFVRTGARRYMVRADRDGHPPMIMDPAPGYDDFVPHDLFHYVVERELGVALGVFGQLAGGGDAGTFYLGPTDVDNRTRSRLARRIKTKGRKLEAAGRADASFSERAVGLCEVEWRARTRRPAASSSATLIARQTEVALADYSEEDRSRLTPAAIDLVCRRLEKLGTRWRGVSVGEGLTLEWSGSGSER